MITKKTVLVLGAGASAHVGFPLASKLRHEVIRVTNRGSSTPLLKMGFSAEEMVQFSRDLRDASGASVDAFLERRDNPRYTAIGKAAMAGCLIGCENPKNVSAIELEVQNLYRPLLAAMDCSFEDIKDNQLSVITFNYDRSLEHFLFIAFKSLHGRTPDECLEALSTIPIIHVHGQLGKYPAEEYTMDPSRRDLESCANQIKIPQDLSSYGSDVDDILTAADRICFIGFGYYRLNLERLKLHEIIDCRKQPAVQMHFGPAEQDIWGTIHELPPKTEKMLRTEWPMINLSCDKGKEFLETITLDD